MTKKIIFLLTASMLSFGIMTGCSGTSGTSQTDDGQAVIQSNDQNTSDSNSTDASGSSVNTVIGTDKTSGDNGNTTAAQNSGSNYITEEEASSIALSKVEGATSDDLRIKKDTDDGKNIYEISILYDNVEYDFEIDAATGNILEQSSELEDGHWLNNNTNYISEKEAKKIALGQVTGASETDLRIHKDNDDGKDIYEGSIVYNEIEYEFEIDAATGNIIDWSSESIYD